MCWIEGKAWRLRSPLRKRYPHFERDESWDKATESNQNREANVGPWWGKPFDQMLGKRQITLWPSFNVQTDSASSALPHPARTPQNYVGDKVGKTAANPPHEVSCSVKGSKWFCFAKLRFLKRNGSQRATQRGNSLTCIHGVLTTEGSTERALAGVDRLLSPQDLEKYLFKMSWLSFLHSPWKRFPIVSIIFSSGELLWSEKN